LIIESRGSPGLGGFGVRIALGAEMDITGAGLTHLRVLIRVFLWHITRMPASISILVFFLFRWRDIDFFDIVLIAFVSHDIPRRFTIDSRTVFQLPNKIKFY
jgi:hypothetical protein